MTSFEQFVNQRVRNLWIKEPGIQIYVRKSLTKERGDFELANMNADRPGKGALTNFLDKYEGQYQFFVENIQEPRLEAYLLRRGYERVGDLEPPSYLFKKGKDRGHEEP